MLHKRTGRVDDELAITPPSHHHRRPHPQQQISYTFFHPLRSPRLLCHFR